MEKSTDNEPTSTQPEPNGKTARLEESPIFALRPHRAEAPRKNYNRRKWILTGAFAIVLGIALVIGSRSFGMGLQSANQLSGLAGGSADTDTPVPTSTSTEAPTATLLPTATPSLEVGSTWTRPADGMTMMYIPQGPFTMGIPVDAAQAECQKIRKECSKSWFADEQPPHLVELDAYWMDQTEVTNAMYSLCVDAGTCEPPKQASSDTVENYYGNPDYANYPVTNVDWNQANNYCQWAGGRLPTEAEWEKAARGTDERTFPWGSALPDCSLLNFNPFNGHSCKGDTSAVRDYPNGQSPYQIFNLAGNVYEWVADWYDPNYYATSPSSNPQGPPGGLAKVMRGGSWFFEAEFARSTYRYRQDPRYYYSFTGFRCVRPE